MLNFYIFRKRAVRLVVIRRVVKTSLILLSRYRNMCRFNSGVSRTTTSSSRIIDRPRSSSSINTHFCSSISTTGVLSERFSAISFELFKFNHHCRPEVKFFCDVDYDPFLFMQDNNKVYSELHRPFIPEFCWICLGFTISLYEWEPTIPTLWETVKGELTHVFLEKSIILPSRIS